MSRRLGLEEELAVERALDLAFAPERLVTTRLSPARVRARLAWDRPSARERAWRNVAVMGRLGEMSLAVGLTAMLFVGSLGTIEQARPAAPTDAPLVTRQPVLVGEAAVAPAASRARMPAGGSLDEELLRSAAARTREAELADRVRGGREGLLR